MKVLHRDVRNLTKALVGCHEFFKAVIMLIHVIYKLIHVFGGGAIDVGSSWCALSQV